LPNSEPPEAPNFLCEYVLDHGWNLGFALEAKPWEWRADLHHSTSGQMLALIATAEHPRLVGVNAEMDYEQMAGLNLMHVVAQAWQAHKLFHIELNDQSPRWYDQDLRLDSRDPKGAFFHVRFPEKVGYRGCRHFDAHAVTLLVSGRSKFECVIALPFPRQPLGESDLDPRPQEYDKTIVPAPSAPAWKCPSVGCA
jgi:hypothetical protein